MHLKHTTLRDLTKWVEHSPCIRHLCHCSGRCSSTIPRRFVPSVRKYVHCQTGHIWSPRLITVSWFHAILRSPKQVQSIFSPFLMLFLLLLFNYDKSFLLPWKCPDKHRSSQECHPALSTWRWRLPCYRHLDDRVGGRLNYSTMFPYFQARNFEEATWAHGDGDGIELGLGRR